MIDEKKKELLQKLYALAERGDRGERDAARRQLDKLLEKYNIDEAELADDVIEMHWFTCKNDQERTLFYQICYKVAPDRDTYKKNYGKGQRSQKGIKFTKAESLQIEIELEFYKRLWEEEMEFFLRCFIQKHQIFDTRPGCKTSEIDRKTQLRMSMLMNGMQDRTLHKMIEA